MASALRVVGSKPGAPESTWSPIHSPSAHTGGHERCPSLTPHWPLGHWRLQLPPTEAFPGLCFSHPRPLLPRSIFPPHPPWLAGGLAG